MSDEHDTEDNTTEPEEEPKDSKERASWWPGAGSDDKKDDQRQRLEGLLGNAIRRAVEKGVEAGMGTFNIADKAVSKADKAVRNVVDDVKLPKEVVGYVFSQVDETKNVLVRAVAREVHDFLEATDIASEMQRALTSLSFEIKTEIRFIPNDAGGVRPRVKARVKPKRKGKDVKGEDAGEVSDESTTKDDS